MVQKSSHSYSVRQLRQITSYGENRRRPSKASLSEKYDQNTTLYYLCRVAPSKRYEPTDPIFTQLSDALECTEVAWRRSVRTGLTVWISILINLDPYPKERQ